MYSTLNKLTRSSMNGYIDETRHRIQRGREPLPREFHGKLFEHGIINSEGRDESSMKPDTGFNEVEKTLLREFHGKLFEHGIINSEGRDESSMKPDTRPNEVENLFPVNSTASFLNMV